MVIYKKKLNVMNKRISLFILWQPNYLNDKIAEIRVEKLEYKFSRFEPINIFFIRDESN